MVSAQIPVPSSELVQMARRLVFARLAIGCVCALLALVTARADQDDEAYVTIGSAVKLQHVSTKYRLHSHEVTCVPRRARSATSGASMKTRAVGALPLLRRGAALTPAARSYGTGSGQQSVTGYPDGDDSNSLWVVRPALGEPHLPQGTRVSKGTRIRLQHLETRRWLHSHSHLSPLSGRVAQAQRRLFRTLRLHGGLLLSVRRQQEVSAFGDDNQSNTNDNWRCVLPRREAIFRQHGARCLTRLVAVRAAWTARGSTGRRTKR